MIPSLEKMELDICVGEIEARLMRLARDYDAGRQNLTLADLGIEGIVAAEDVGIAIMSYLQRERRNSNQTAREILCLIQGW